MVLCGTVPELARQVLGGAYRIHLQAEGPADLLEDAFRRLNGVLRVHRSTASTYELEAEADVRAEAAQSVVQSGGRLLALDIQMPDLDEVYARYFAQEVEHVPVR